MKNTVFTLAIAASLTSCATNYTYVPIVSQPRQIDMAEAQCQMMSSSAQQGMVAWGTPGYVAGAQLGNAIGNAIRVDQFMQQCMTLQGWKRVAKQEGPAKVTPASTASGLTPQQRKNAVDTLAMGHIAQECKVPIAANRKSDLAYIRSHSSPDIIKEGRAVGDKTMNDGAKTIGRTEFCKKAVGVIKGMGWS